MATLTFKGLTPGQAKVLANWYEGQGEQCEGLAIMLEAANEPGPVYAQVQRKGGCIEKDGDNTILHCYTPR